MTLFIDKFSQRIEVCDKSAQRRMTKHREFHLTPLLLL